MFTVKSSDHFTPLPLRMPKIVCRFFLYKDKKFSKTLDLKTDKSPGPHNIHPRVIFETKLEIYKPLTILYNRSLQMGSVPDTWKQSIVSVLHKKGNKHCIENYRPISLTCIICKVLESIIRDKVMTYIVENHLLSDYQFGLIYNY